MNQNLRPDALFGKRVVTLYRTTDDDLLIETNAANPVPAPRALIGRTRSAVVCRTRDDQDPMLAAALARLAETLPPLPSHHGEVSLYASIIAAVEAAGPIQETWYGPSYYFARPPRPLHRDVVEVRGPDFESTQPCWGVFVGERLVSRCSSGCTSADAAEADVYTDPEYRGRGYASAAVNSWRIAVESMGRTPLYSTTYDNLGSQGIARSLGTRQYAETLLVE